MKVQPGCWVSEDPREKSADWGDLNVTFLLKLLCKYLPNSCTVHAALVRPF